MSKTLHGQTVIVQTSPVENALLMRPRVLPPNPQVILATHGHGGSFAEWEPAHYVHGAILVHAGFVVLSLDCQGTAKWAASAVMTAMDSAYALAMANIPGAASKVGVLSYSMGGAPAAAWTALNPSKVAGLLGVNAALDARLFWDTAYTPPYSLGTMTQPVGNYTSDFTAAYGTPLATTVAPTDPFQMVTSLRQGVPILWLQANDDAVVAPAQCAYLASQINRAYVTVDNTTYGGGTSGIAGHVAMLAPPSTDPYGLPSGVATAPRSQVFADFFGKTAVWI